MALNRSFKLNSGYTIPAVGLGTWQSGPNEVKEAVAAALKIGYRHIDAAAIYGNEAEVGEGIKASGVARESIFVTGKLWNTDHKPKDVEQALDTSLKDLQTDYLHLFLIHWPVACPKSVDRFPVDPSTEQISVIDVPIADTWRAREALVAKGKVRSIGVSNFAQKKIKTLLESVMDDETIIGLAKQLGKQPAQLLISWTVQRGTVVLPKSVTESRIRDNFQDFELPQEVFNTIDALEKHTRYNFPARLGVDIFDEVSPESLKKSVEDWKALQRQLKVAA